MTILRVVLIVRGVDIKKYIKKIVNEFKDKLIFSINGVSKLKMKNTQNVSNNIFKYIKIKLCRIFLDK